MNDKLQKLISEVKDEHAKEVLTEIENHVADNKKDLLLLTLGKINLADNLSTVLRAQTIRTLQYIRDEHLYRSAGFSRFDDFLDEYSHSPMNYKKFNRLESLLETEGDILFDTFTSLSIPQSKRKLLGKGNVQIEGETLFIKSDNDEADVEIELKDRNRILETLSALADANAEKSKKLDSQKTKIEKGEAEIEKLQKKLDAGVSGGESPHKLHYEDFMRSCNSIDALAETVKKLPADEAAAYGELYFGSLNAALARLRAAYQRAGSAVEFIEDSPGKPVPQKVKGKSESISDFDRIDEIVSSMSDEELEAIMN